MNFTLTVQQRILQLTYCNFTVYLIGILAVCLSNSENKFTVHLTINTHFTVNLTLRLYLFYSAFNCK